jgi:S1-C subfamily serine protease
MRVLLLIIALLFSCAPSEDLMERRILQSRSSIATLLAEGVSCTAFGIGKYWVTASHCIFPNKDYYLVDSEGEAHLAQIQSVNIHTDVAIIISDYTGNMTLWGYGPLNPGMSIASLGFPGYYLREFTFETGSISGILEKDGRSYIMSKELAFPGGSGGPVISLRTGEVIGMVHALIVIEKKLDTSVSPVTISLIVPWTDIKAELSKDMTE